MCSTQYHLLGPFEASSCQIPLDNHVQAARIQGALDDNNNYGAHHNYGLNNIRPDDSLQAANRGVKYANNTHRWRNYMNIYARHCERKAQQLKETPVDLIENLP